MACRYAQSRQTLFALSALVTRTRQQLAMFVLSHLFPSFFYDTAQWLTSFPFTVKYPAYIPPVETECP
jgi:hypothetical protein